MSSRSRSTAMSSGVQQRVEADHTASRFAEKRFIREADAA